MTFEQNALINMWEGAGYRNNPQIFKEGMYFVLYLFGLKCSLTIFVYTRSKHIQR